MLDTAMMTDLAQHLGGGMRGQDPDHRQSPCVDSAISLSLSTYEHGQGQGGEDL
jgi:hypothetical protein